MDELRSELEAWRVARKIRTSGESLRATLRDRLGGDRTTPAPGPRPRALGAAIGDQLPAGASTQRIVPAERAAARPGERGGGGARRRVVLAGAGLAALAALVCVAIVLALRAPASTSPEVAASAPPAPPAMREDPPAPRATPTPSVPVPTAAPAPAPADAALAEARDAAAPAPIATGARPLLRRTGKLRVNVVPWANVRFDDQPLGQTPIDLDVAAGRHRVTLHNPDTGDRVEKWIEIEPDRIAEVRSW